MNDQAKRWTAESDVVCRDGYIMAECAGNNATATRLAACADLLRGVEELEGVVVIPGWVKCSEHRPEPGQSVLVAPKHSAGNLHVASYQPTVPSFPFRLGWTNMQECEIGHWMPLPVPPKGDA